jgi:hypothetical protein
MRVIRLSMFKNPDEHVDMVMRESDLSVPIEEMPRQMRMQDFPVLFDLFYMPDGVDIQQATFEAMQRMRARASIERNMAILYFWFTRSLLRVLTPGGMWQAKDPAPIGADDVAFVFQQIAEHSGYRGQTLRTASNDGFIVVMVNGRVSRERYGASGMNG